MTKNTTKNVPESVIPDSPKDTSKKKRPVAVPKTAPDAQTAKDFSTLIKQIGEQNTPTSSKEITAFAKETLKLVAKSQASESASFRREATKALLQFKTLVEKSDKLTETRRDKLLGDLDDVTLDAKNAAFYMLSNAKMQAKQIKVDAKTEAILTRKQTQAKSKATLIESKEKAKLVVDEARLKSKTFTEEQIAKQKAYTVEHKARLAEILRVKQETIKERKAKARERYDSLKSNLNEKATNRKDKAREQYDKLKAGVVEQAEKRKAADIAAKFNFQQQSQAIKDKLREDRKQSAEQVSRMRSKVNEDRTAKRKLDKESMDQRKKDMLSRNKSRIQKIRDMTSEHKTKLKTIESDAKLENIRKQRTLKDELDEQKRKEEERKRNAKEFRNKLGEGIRDANPFFAGIFDMAKGIFSQFGPLMKKKKDETEDASANAAPKAKTSSGAVTAAGVLTAVAIEQEANLVRLEHIQEDTAKSVLRLEHDQEEVLKAQWELVEEQRLDRPKKEHTPRNKLQRIGGKSGPAAINGPAISSAAAVVGGSVVQSESSGSSGGMFDGIVGMVSSIGSFLSSVGGLASKLLPMLNLARTIPIVAAVGAVVMGVYNFIEGFNNATALFGEKVADDDYTKRIFAGFTNVFAGVLGIFDTVAGWLGFDTNIKKKFEEAAVVVYEKVANVVESITSTVPKLFEAIMNGFKTFVGGLASVLAYVPGMSDIAKSLEVYSKGGATNITAPEKPTSASKIASKQSEVNNLQDEVEAKKGSSRGQVSVAVDNSVKSNQTNVMQSKMSTRNDDVTHRTFGYGK